MIQCGSLTVNLIYGLTTDNEIFYNDELFL